MIASAKQIPSAASNFSNRELLGTVLFGVSLCGFFRMMSGLQMVAVGNVGMMSCLYNLVTISGSQNGSRANILPVGKREHVEMRQQRSKD
jgi:hypothetical protein